MYRLFHNKVQVIAESTSSIILIIILLVTFPFIILVTFLFLSVFRCLCGRADFSVSVCVTNFSVCGVCVRDMWCLCEWRISVCGESVCVCGEEETHWAGLIGDMTGEGTPTHRHHHWPPRDALRKQEKLGQIPEEGFHAYFFLCTSPTAKTKNGQKFQ